MQIRVPNITGYLCKSDFSNDTSYTGVFSQTERGSAWSGGSSGYENTWDRPYFSARAANSTYGSSSVVQPASIRLMQANNRTDAGCTVDAVPLVLENAPVGVVPFVFRVFGISG